MRIIILAASTALAALSMSWAAPATAASDVQVTIGPDLQAQAERKYGVRDVDRLAEGLRRNVQRELDRTGAYDGARVELTLVDVTPNHPTFKELVDRPGLSVHSVSLGGARIEGRAIAADGAITPLSYAWYENDIRQASNGATWSDAQWTIDRFAYQLGRGQVVSAR